MATIIHRSLGIANKVLLTQTFSRTLIHFMCTSLVLLVPQETPVYNCGICSPVTIDSAKEVMVGSSRSIGNTLQFVNDVDEIYGM